MNNLNIYEFRLYTFCPFCAHLVCLSFLLSFAGDAVAVGLPKHPKKLNLNCFGFPHFQFSFHLSIPPIPWIESGVRWKQEDFKDEGDSAEDYRKKTIFKSFSFRLFSHFPKLKWFLSIFIIRVAAMVVIFSCLISVPNENVFNEFSRARGGISRMARRMFLRGREMTI